MRLGFKVAIGIGLIALSASANAAVVAVGVAAGAIAGLGFGTTVYTAISIGFGAAALFQSLTMKVPSASKTASELKQTTQMSRAPRQYSIGHCYRAGTVLFLEEQEGDKEGSDGTYKEWLYSALGFADHPIESVIKVNLNDTSLDEFGSIAVVNIYNNSNDTDQTALDNSPSWDEDMKADGCTWIAAHFRYDREKFTNGIPNTRLEFEGHNGIIDFRYGTTGYTNNAALVIAWYLMEFMNIPIERLILDGHGSFIDAANLCDELVINEDGSSSTRYTINGTFTADEEPIDTLNDMLASCGAMLVRVSGRYGLLPAAYYGTGVNFTLDSKDIVGDVTVQVEKSYADRVNTITGTYVSIDDGFVETDYPPVIDDNAYAADGVELNEDMSFRFVTDVWQAQRLASIKLKQSLAGGEIQLTTNLRGLYARQGRVINLNIPERYLIGEYRVTSQSVDPTALKVTLTLAREDLLIYDDAIGVPYEAPPLTNLSNGEVAPPTGVQFLVDVVGEVVQGFIQWSINAPQAATTDIRIKDYATNEVIISDNVAGNTYQVNGLVYGSYIAEVRTVTSLNGRVSAWAATTFIVEVPANPSSVEVESSNWNVELVPTITGGVPSGTLFEFRHKEDSESYLTGQPSYSSGNISISNEVAISSSLNKGGLTPDRYQHFWIRSVNVYGESDWVYVRTGTLKDQDLVTTVVERLEAIEIVSSNYEQGKNGYKLWPDGNAEFNDIIARGDLYADSLTFNSTDAIPDEINNDNVLTITTYRQNNAPTGNIVKGSTWYDTDDNNHAYYYNGSSWLSIQDEDISEHEIWLNSLYPNQSTIQISSGNYISGSRGWAIDEAGNAEFYNAVIRGTLYAQDILGDVASVSNIASSYENTNSQANTWYTIATFTVDNNDSYINYVTVMPILIQAISGSAQGAINLQYRVIDNSNNIVDSVDFGDLFYTGSGSFLSIRETTPVITDSLAIGASKTYRIQIMQDQLNGSTLKCLSSHATIMLARNSNSITEGS